MSSAPPVTGCPPAAWKRPTSAARLRRPEAGTDREPSEVEAELVQLVRERIGAVSSLKDVVVVAALPRSRSGKILHKWNSLDERMGPIDGSASARVCKRRPLGLGGCLWPGTCPAEAGSVAAEVSAARSLGDG
ncbi:AMP-binding enzyme [Streptomyces sp. MB09-02B]|uniref:AMP-binding enzyme n=1 Tax=Streptomyces sp. MB09-02B TaxID=3028667 RepID=UPI0029A88B47|nr:hypothetical protein [Streptomyces sp. MB09-02B]MDX3641725.1 hypothetical protein [Streptomyces sp. MB09-02B]